MLRAALRTRIVSCNIPGCEDFELFWRLSAGTFTRWKSRVRVLCRPFLKTGETRVYSRTFL